MGIKTVREDQVHLRIAGTLRSALEFEATAAGLGLSGLIRNIIVENIAQRITARTKGATPKPHSGEATV